MPTLSPQILNDRYVLLPDPIGIGGGSVLYHAAELRNGLTRVAVKIVTGEEPPAVLRAFFLRETAALSRLRQENIIRLLEQGFTEGIGTSGARVRTGRLAPGPQCPRAVQ